MCNYLHIININNSIFVFETLIMSNIFPYKFLFVWSFNHRINLPHTPVLKTPFGCFYFNFLLKILKFQFGKNKLEEASPSVKSHSSILLSSSWSFLHHHCEDNAAPLTSPWIQLLSFLLTSPHDSYNHTQTKLKKKNLGSG